MGIVNTAGESSLKRRVMHLIRSASGSINGLSRVEFWKWAIFRDRSLFCALRIAEEAACGACSACGRLTVDIRTIFHEVSEDVAYIARSCGELLIVGLGKIIGVSARLGKRAYVSHVTCEDSTIGGAAGDISTIWSLVPGGLARKPSLHADLLLSEPLNQLLFF